MSKPTKILSFNDYASKGSAVVETTKTEVKTAIKKPVAAAKPLPVKKVIKESAFAVGSDYKVKLAIDIPQSLVSDFVAKVKKDTGKDALANFTNEELAEEMIRYIVKTKLSVDNLSTAIAVGEGASSSPEQTETANETEIEQPQPVEEEDGEEDPFKDETQEIEFDDDDDDAEPVKVQKATSKMDFEGTEVNLGEKENIELDSNQPIKK